MLKLYDYWRSSAAYRVRIGLNLKGVDYESLPINLLKDEQLGDAYRAVNPQARVPTLQTPQGLLTQSLSILVWLDQTYPEPRLVPADPWAGAQVRAFALTIGCDIHPIDNLSALNRLRTQFGADEAAIGEWFRHWIIAGFTALEAQAAQRPDTPYVFGDTPGLADIMLVPQMANARRYKTDLSPFPRLGAWDERARAHPAFIKAAPENQKDAIKK